METATQRELMVGIKFEMKHEFAWCGTLIMLGAEASHGRTSLEYELDNFPRLCFTQRVLIQCLKGL